MGVYIYRSIHGPFIKVGHYAGQNAYSRVAHRGFFSCVCPNHIRDKVTIDDLELIAWFPSLTKKEERLIKTKWKTCRIHKSEWFPQDKLEDIQSFLESMEPNQKNQCCRQSAIETRRRL